MTMLADPPQTQPPDSSPRALPSASSVPSWRLASRLARREVRRRPGRTLLTATLIAVPVFAMTVASVLLRTENDDWASRYVRQYGQSDLVISAYPQTEAVAVAGEADPSPEPPRPELPAGTRTIDYFQVFAPLQPLGDSARAGERFVTVTDLPLDDAMTKGIVEISSGVAPGANEMLIAPEVAKYWGVWVGDSVTFDRPSGTWTISGIGRMADNHAEMVAVVNSFDRSRLRPDTFVTVTLYDFPDAMSQQDIQRYGASLPAGYTGDRFTNQFQTDVTTAMAWGWIAGVLALVAVGIIVAAAFATSARRQLATLGQLAANGATPTVLRRTLSLQGFWTGVLGGVGGIGVGLLALPFLRGVTQSILNHSLSGYRIAVGDLVVIAITAVVAGTVAAAVPSRSASRIPVMAALAGRRPVSRPPRWLVPTGIGLFVGGLCLLALAALGSSSYQSGGSDHGDLYAFVAVVGGVAVMFGMCCATPLIITQIGRMGRRLPLAWRLSVRSVARTRTRSAGVATAIATVVAFCTVGLTVSESIIAQDQIVEGGPPSELAMIGYYEYDACCDSFIDEEPLDPPPMPSSVGTTIDRWFPDATVDTIRAVTFDPSAFDPNTDLDGLVYTNRGPTIADQTVVDAMRLSRDDQRLLDRVGALSVGFRSAATDVAQDTVQINYATESGVVELTAGVAGTTGAGWYGTDVIITPELASELGFDVVDAGLMVDNGSRSAVDRSATCGRRSVGRAQQWGKFPFVEPGESTSLATPGGSGYVVDFRYVTTGFNVWLARLIGVAVALVITLLVVVAIGLSLAATEGRVDRDTLAVVGAKPSTLRHQAGVTGLVLASTGVLLGIPTGYIPTWWSIAAKMATTGVNRSSWCRGGRCSRCS